MADAPHAGNASDDKGPTILAILWSLTAFTTVIVTARMYIRVRMLHNVGPDDWLIVSAMIMGLVYCGITQANISIGYGKHAWTLDPETVERASFLNTLSFLFGILSFAIPKLAVVAMLHRILNPSLWQKTALWVLVGTGTAISVVCIILLFTMCDPPRALWETSLILAGKATCRDVWFLIKYAIFTGVSSAFIDLTLAVYPTTVLMKLHMSLRKRLALCAALGLGAIASAMAIVKCTQLKGLADKSDYTYGTADLVIWTNVESNVVIIASCIPTLQPVLELMLGKRKLGSYNSSGHRYKGSSRLQEYSYDNSKASKARKQHTDLTITGVESQESILGDQQGPGENRGHPLGAIRRTDNVTVEYENKGYQSQDNARGSW